MRALLLLLAAAACAHDPHFRPEWTVAKLRAVDNKDPMGQEYGGWVLDFPENEPAYAVRCRRTAQLPGVSVFYEECFREAEWQELPYLVQIHGGPTRRWSKSLDW